MTKIENLDNYPEFKTFLHDNFLAMIKELVDQETELIKTYHNNPTVPFDYYNLTIRDINSKIMCKREVYKRLTGEELE